MPGWRQMLDMEAEGERFVQIAERLHAAGLTERYVACGSVRFTAALRRCANSVKGINLEVWDPVQFERMSVSMRSLVETVGLSLEDAVDVFGRVML